MPSPRAIEITDAMLAEMKLHDIVDTPENRLSFLTGLREGWMEDPDDCIEKTFYLVTITLMIATLKMQVSLR